MLENHKEITLGNNWNWKLVDDLIHKKLLTDFYYPSDEEDLFHKMECIICYQYFPFLNKFPCGSLICTKCFLAMTKPTDTFECPHCRGIFQINLRKWEIEANYYEEAEDEKDNDLAISFNGSPSFSKESQYPADIFDIASEYGLNIKEVEELLKSGVVIREPL